MVLAQDIKWETLASPKQTNLPASHHLLSTLRIGLLARIFILHALIALSVSCGTSNEKPNIVLILIDDLGWKDIGVTGSDYYQTPHIDRLAAEGMLFTQAYSACLVCAPSRGAILTGKYPARTKYTAVFDDAGVRDDRLCKIAKDSIWKGEQRLRQQSLEGLHRQVLPTVEVTFAEVLRDEGYTTGFVGKWHGGLGEEHSPLRQGFDYAEGFETTSYNTPGHFGRGCIGKVFGMENLGPDDSMADALTSLAVRFIERNQAQPFAFMLSHWAVHTPLQARPEEIARWDAVPKTDQFNSVYAAMVESVDRSVGRVVESLNRLELSDNTLIIFTSDNGGLTGWGEEVTSNYPLLGGKSFPYEAGTRVPLIVKWPGHVKPGSRTDVPVIGMDIHATLLDCAGVPTTDPNVDGVSLKPVLLETGALPSRLLGFHFPHYTGFTGPYSAIRSENWKLIRFYNDTSGRHQLFHLAEDPYEQDDLAGKNSRRLEALSRQLDDWLESVDASIPPPNPDFDEGLEPLRDLKYVWDLAQEHRDRAKFRLDHAGQSPVP